MNSSFIRGLLIVAVLTSFLWPAKRATAAKTPGTVHHIGVEGQHFVLDGEPLQIISGEIHYARIPREYWRDRLKKARAMGLNTVSTYVFWNVHEPKPGVFDFSGMHDVAAFIRMAQEEGLYVILRPGPYSCAEWDLGGYPPWLLANPDIVLRSGDEKFMRPAERWLKRLGEELAPLQITHGGPIIAVQVENEYGSFGNNKAYMQRILAAIRNAGLGDVLLYTADGGDELPAGTLPELQAVVNFGPGSAREEFAKLEKFRPGRPLMSGEYWDGWFDHWGAKHETTDAEQQAKEIDWILSQGYSINLYMVHGGTSFGFMSGANWDHETYEPDVTSYDYDCAVSEPGGLTKKYFAFRDVIAKHRPGVKIPEPPTPLPVIEVPAFQLNEAAPLWSNLPSPLQTEKPRNMEAFGQSYGYILYRTRLKTPAAGEMKIPEMRSYARVFVEGREVGTLDRRKKQDHLPIHAGANATLDILVEGTGRINFSIELRNERQGINGPVTVDGKELTGWQVFPLPMDDLSSLRFSAASGKDAGPAFYRGTFNLKQSADTFLDTRGWGHGAVWVNGHAVGRYWNVGPQQTLYIPGPWLREGKNEVVVFAQGQPRELKLRALKQPVLDELGQE
ncbi:MAG TPA: glycoside hydrolase family 35 protein [Candidatus Sulfotelmatobacter sp.]|nr:glycoside hydrolase family 35 protein [Candidatus Sulfotelmatobacter sp.]